MLLNFKRILTPAAQLNINGLPARSNIRAASINFFLLMPSASSYDPLVLQKHRGYSGNLSYSLTQKIARDLLKDIKLESSDYFSNFSMLFSPALGRLRMQEMLSSNDRKPTLEVEPTV